MTSRERILAAARGGETDRKPVVNWPAWQPDSDVRFEAGAEDQVFLQEVDNPFGLAMRKGLDLNVLLKEDPHNGNQKLNDLCEETRRNIGQAFEKGADGILYRLYGARAKHCTPMQYGGFYLERDRELLEEISDALFNLIFVVGEEDVYLDFVSDLPGHAFAWDIASSKVPVSEVRAMRPGALACDDLEADIVLKPGTDFLSRTLEESLRLERSYAV